MDTETTQDRPEGLSAVMGERHRLINLAYRMLGSLADAEDVVQETYARWYAMSRRQQEAITTPVGGAQPREAPALDHGLTRAPSGCLS